MDTIDPERLAEVPDRNAVLRQTEDLLGHVAFRKSIRCTKLLRYLVEKSLDDPHFHPKERTLAIEVFGRRPDYDTAADPIVRTTANEIRKRLGSYFHDTGPAAEVFIELPSGSYRPVFRTAAVAAPVNENPPGPRAFPSRGFRNYILAACLAGAMVPIVVGALVSSWHWPQSNADRFWHPFLYPPRKIIVCPPSYDLATQTSNRGFVPAVNGTPMISVSDSKAVWRVLSVLVKGQDNVSIRASDRIQAGDLREHPAIIIGGSNNPWAAVVISRLRFQLASDDSTQTARIIDQQSPSDRRWSVDTRDLSKNDSRSYALISRMINPVTHNPVMSIAGVGMYATAAAGEFVAEPQYLNALGSALDHCGNNLQIVLSAEATNGVVRKRNVEAIHCW